MAFSENHNAISQTVAGWRSSHDPDGLGRGDGTLELPPDLSKKMLAGEITPLEARTEWAAREPQQRAFNAGRTETQPFYASTARARALKAWGWKQVEQDGKRRWIKAREDALEPITPHEARHCAISYFIAAGMDWKQISTWAGHSDVRQTWNRYGHLVPGGEQAAAERLNRYLDGSTVAQTVAQDLGNAKTLRLAGSS